MTFSVGGGYLSRGDFSSNALNSAGMSSMSGNTIYGAMGVRAAFSESWSGGASLHLGQMRMSGLAVGGGSISGSAVATAFSLDLVGRSVLVENDTLTLSLGSPLASVSGSVRGAPAGSAGNAEVLRLGNQTREVSVSAAWQRPVGENMNFVAGLSHHFNAGHVSGRNDTRLGMGLTIRF
jgi:hypothetical protein